MIVTIFTCVPNRVRFHCDSDYFHMCILRLLRPCRKSGALHNGDVHQFVCLFVYLYFYWPSGGHRAAAEGVADVSPPVKKMYAIKKQERVICIVGGVVSWIKLELMRLDTRKVRHDLVDSYKIINGTAGR